MNKTIEIVLVNKYGDITTIESILHCSPLYHLSIVQYFRLNWQTPFVTSVFGFICFQKQNIT